MDNLACNEEHGDLLLGGQGDRLKGRNVGADHEEMWILRQCRDLRIGQIVAVERRAVGQVSRAPNRGARTGTPARLVMPGPLMSDGIREASAWPRTGRPAIGDSRLFSVMGAPAEVRTPARTLVSTLRNTVP